MVGQLRLQNIVRKYIETNSLPRTLLFEGENGCGKHTLANYVSELLGFAVEDITDILTLETIERITLSAIPHVYIINTSDISVKEQNIILKFLEEPLKNSYIILLCENKSMLLNTVVNRCICLAFENYTHEELASFIEDTTGWTGEMFFLANTPGRVIQFQQLPISEMIEFAKKVLLQVRLANYSNILRIPNKINFKDKEDLYDFDLFAYLLVNEADVLYTTETIPFSVYELTRQFYNDTKIPHINKQHLFEHYLIELKQLYEGVK